MEENADSLVARPWQIQALGLGAEPPVHLGDRDPPIIEPVESPEQARRDPRRKGEHIPSVRQNA